MKFSKTIATNKAKGVSKYLTTTALAIGGVLVLSAPAQADNWTNLENAGGSFTTDTSTPNLTAITQTSQIAKARGDLDITENHHVDIRQNNSQSIFAAYDIEGDPTRILGKLTANGKVLVIDQNGVFFGPNSTVDVGSLLVTTGTVDEASLNNGKINISLGNNSGAIENQGSITVSEGGLAAFVAPAIANSGAINANLGTVALASGTKATVDLYGDNLVEIAVGDEKLSDSLVENAGTIKAEGGKIIITADAAKDVVNNVINTTGILDVSSATVQGGKIILNGGTQGTVKVSGTVNASGNGAGSVDVKGQAIVADGKIKADGGNGSVTLWGDDSTLFYGEISALGENGFVETSGGKLGVHGNVILSEGGEWLLDPTDLWVMPGDADGGPGLSGGTFSPDDTIPVPPSGDSWYWVGVNFINNALNNGSNVTLRTHKNGTRDGDIQINADILKTAGSDATLRLQAHDDITLNNSITSTFGKLNVVLTSDYDNSGNLPGDTSDVTLAGGANILTNGGVLTVTAPGNFTIGGGSLIDAQGGNVSIAQKGIFYSADAGSIRTSGTGMLRLIQNDGGSIQNLLDSISNTGTGLSMLNIGAGTYNEAVVITKAVRLQGANWGVNGASGSRGAESIIIVPGGSNGVTVSSSNVIVDGFTVSGGINGIQVGSPGKYSNVKILNNIVDGSAAYGINMIDGIDSQINKNLVTNTGGAAIRANFGKNLIVSGNTVDGAGAQGININNLHGASVTGNIIDNTGDDAIRITNSSDYVSVTKNLIGTISGNVAGDGIYLHNVKSGGIRGNTITGLVSNGWNNGSGVYLSQSSDIRVGGPGADSNAITYAAWDGIKIEGGTGNTIENNVITDPARTGIYSAKSSNLKIQNNTITDAALAKYGAITVEEGSDISVLSNTIDEAVYGILMKKTSGTKNRINGNIITDTSNDGILIQNTAGFITVNGNSIKNAGNDGIEASNAAALKLTNNTIEDSAVRGLYVNGASSGTFEVAGNTFRNNPVGAQFNAGTIDLTGDSNTFDGGEVALRFSGKTVALVDDDGIGGFDGTIGDQIFIGQTKYYVELLNGAFYDTVAGAPLFLNGGESSYDSFRPSDYADYIIPDAAYDYLEGKFWHYNDTGLDGLFFFGALEPEVTASINQEDVFNTFAAFNGNISGLNVRILGLPRIPGGEGNLGANLNNIQTFAGGNNPENLNNIETAAGGDDQNGASPETLSNIETQAGDETASCWGDAVNAASSGQAVNVVYGGGNSLDETLSQAASCSSQL